MSDEELGEALGQELARAVIEPLLGFQEMLKQDPDWMLMLLGGALMATPLREVGRTIRLFAMLRQFDRRYMPLIKAVAEAQTNAKTRQASSVASIAGLVSKARDIAQIIADDDDDRISS